MNEQQEPRLLVSQLTKQPYVVTKYRTSPNGLIVAEEKHDLRKRDLLDAMYALGVEGAALDEVARVLGFVPKEAGQ